MARRSRLLPLPLLALAAAAGAAAQTHAPVGPQVNVAEPDLTGWSVCHSSTYASSGTSVAGVLEACTAPSLMLACRPVGSATFTLLAWAPRADVLFAAGTSATSSQFANGAEWYFSDSYSWGFADGGDAVTRNSCYVQSTNADRRMCVHTSSGALGGGYRCGATGLNSDASWERVVLGGSATVPTQSTTASATPTPSGTVTAGVSQLLSLSSGWTMWANAYAGTGATGNTGDGGPPTLATLSPRGVAVDPLTGDVCWGQTPQYVLRCVSSTTNAVYRTAGTGVAGVADSTNPLAATVASPYGLSFHPVTGDLWWVEYSFSVLRVLRRGGGGGVAGVKTMAGGANVAAFADGAADVARMSTPMDLAHHPMDGSIVIADYSNRRLRSYFVNASGALG